MFAPRALQTTHSLIFFFQAEDGIRDYKVTGVQTCALPIFTRLLFQNARRGPRSHLFARRTTPQRSQTTFNPAYALKTLTAPGPAGNSTMMADRKSVV